MRNSTEIKALMKAIDAENENYRYKIAKNMRTREELLREYNKAVEVEKEFKEKEEEINLIHTHL